MDQKKIGAFIMLLRKEKQMTQKDLADKLNISDRTVSKWENGRGLPDVSLLQPLCEELNISINELLNGERKEDHTISEQLFIDTMQYSHTKLKLAHHQYTLIIILILSICLTVGTLFGIDLHRMKNNEPIFFSTWGFDYAPPIDLHEEEIEICIINHINNQNDSHSKHTHNEKWFSSIHPYLIEEIQDKKHYIVYAWVLEESYYFDSKPVLFSASSMAYKFEIKRKESGTYYVSNATHPRDGSYYSEDIKKMFPYSVRKQIDNVHKDGTYERLSLEIKEKVALYFKTKITGVTPVIFVLFIYSKK